MAFTNINVRYRKRIRTSPFIISGYTGPCGRQVTSGAAEDITGMARHNRPSAQSGQRAHNAELTPHTANEPSPLYRFFVD
jgi:hypothetical protein